MDAQDKLDGTLSVDLSVKAIMDTWTLRKGYPVVYVTQRLKSKRNRNNLDVATEAFSRALENINTNIRWLEKNLRSVHEWLDAQINPIEPIINYRLPKSLVPFYYNLTMQPYFNVTQKPEYYMVEEIIKN